MRIALLVAVVLIACGARPAAEVGSAYSPSPAGTTVSTPTLVPSDAERPVASAAPTFALPSAAPPACEAPDAFAAHYAKSIAPARRLPTRAGPVATRVWRDDAWTRPALVPSLFLARNDPSLLSYQEIVCQPVYAYGYGLAEGALYQALAPGPTSSAPALDPYGRAPTIDAPGPGLGLQLWLMDVHFLGMSSDTDGRATVRVERKPGFEWVVFDLEAVTVSPHPSGSLLLRVVDQDGIEVMPTLERQVRASWEYGRAPAP